ncbi:unnamed protein product [Nippostrongylus brasiliensis]|uniref:Molybdopterin domain-containing protein n=1 Tax=Nippostrongylus brasiliensis TaxID=27835 RepID=A0A0N4YDB4_NIPBR|nr:unnamed protein product [Nippostrongylus brasiliensis]
MALYQPADGILKSNLSWEDLQESLIETFGPDAILGPNKDAKDIGLGHVSWPFSHSVVKP